MKYRVITYAINDRLVYMLQYKGLFGLWKCHDIFDCKETAINYIKKYEEAQKKAGIVIYKSK